MDTRTCQHCHRPLSYTARSDARYCSTYCRVSSYRARKCDDSASAIPAVLRQCDRWVRHDAKRPITVTGRAASSTNPRTWSTYAAARASKAGDGLGYVLCGDDGIVCMDLDHCLDDGNLAPWAAAILDTVPATYIEQSPSGHGLHVWGLGKLDRGRVVKVGGGRLEIYGHGRYLTITGQRFAGAPSLLADLSALFAHLTSGLPDASPAGAFAARP